MSEWTCEWWQWRGTLHSPEFKNWSLTIRCSFVSYPGYPTFWWGVLLVCRGYSQVILRRIEYWEESWKTEETCYHSDFRENQQLLVWKISQEIVNTTTTTNRALIQFWKTWHQNSYLNHCHNIKSNFFFLQVYNFLFLNFLLIYALTNKTCAEGDLMRFHDPPVIRIWN